MKYLILCLTLFTTNLYGLDADAIQKLASQPHSRENLVSELKLFPDAREYKITIKSGETVDDLKSNPSLIATEKVVQGRYIISELKYPGVENPLIMVVSYDRKTDVFKKSVLLPNGIVSFSTGVADFKKRTIAWMSNEPQGEPPVSVFSIETHSDELTTWKETYMQNGKVLGVTHGKAVKTK